MSIIFFFYLNLFKRVVWQGRVTKLLHLSESGPVCRCIQQKQTKQKCRADGESQRKDQIIRQLREKKLQVVSTVLTAPFIRQKVHLALEILDFFFFKSSLPLLSFTHTAENGRACNNFFWYGYLKITNVLFRYLETTSFAVSITRSINLLSQCLSEIRNTMSAYIHGVLTTVAANVSWKCQINKRALIINTSEYLDLTSFIPHFWILWSISQVCELRCRLETLLTVTQIRIIYTHLLYGRFVSSLRCIIMNYEVVHTCCSHAISADLITNRKL